jgi:hypothetical protein
MLLGTGVNAVPVLYSYDDSGADAGYFQAGIGTFCLDVGSDLEVYAASNVTGSGSILGEWVGVVFQAEIGSLPTLRIHDRLGNAITTSFPSSSGGTLRTGDVASSEWANFISRAGQVGIVITEISACPTPEGGSTLLMTLAAAGGLIGLARATRSPKNS